MLSSPCFDQVHSERLLHAHCIFAAPLLGLSYADLHPAHEGRALFHHLSRHNKRTHDLVLTQETQKSVRKAEVTLVSETTTPQTGMLLYPSTLDVLYNDKYELIPLNSFGVNVIMKSW